MTAARLKVPEEVAEAKNAFGRVFRSADPFDQPFVSEVRRKRILFPVPYELDQRRLSAILTAAKGLGEEKAYVSLIEGCDDDFEAREHWSVDLTLELYPSLRATGWFPLMENAVYSQRGTWGLIVSHEQHAVLGGRERFAEVLSETLGQAEADVPEFLETWKANRERLQSDVAWVPVLMEHLFGRARAQDLLVAASWNG